MTNFELITKSVQELAQKLVQYNDYDGMFYTTDGDSFETSEDAIEHEIKWLDSEC